MGNGDLADEKHDTVPQRNTLRRFIVDAAISAIVTLVMTAVIWGFIGSFHGMAMWLLIPFGPVLPMLLFSAPVVVAFYGFVKLRAGIMIGPIALVTAFVAWASHYSSGSDRAVHAFVTQSIVPASRPHNVLMTEGGDSYCDIACIHILASSPHSMARKNIRTKGWQLFRRGPGEACLSDAERRSMAMFLEAGFPDLCAIETNVPDVADGLLVRERHLARSHTAAAGLPSAFGGSIYEIIERVDGKDRILGRRVAGHMLSLPVPNAVASFSGGLISEKYIDIGPRIDPKEFLANAIGTTPEKLFRP
jgi:hypothetical protein